MNIANKLPLDAATKPTKETYDGFQLAYERINTGLFGCGIVNWKGVAYPPICN